MRTFDQLTADEQTRAVKRETDDLLTAILEGAIRFNDQLNGDDLQARIDKAIAKADAMRTPWFAGEYVMDLAGDEIEGMARARAEDAKYRGPEDMIEDVITL